MLYEILIYIAPPLKKIFVSFSSKFIIDYTTNSYLSSCEGGFFAGCLPTDYLDYWDFFSATWWYQIGIIGIFCWYHQVSQYIPIIQIYPYISQYTNCWDPNIPTVYLGFWMFFVSQFQSPFFGAGRTLRIWSVPWKWLWSKFEAGSNDQRDGGWRKKVWRKMEVKHHPTFVDSVFRFFNMIVVKNPSESWIFLAEKNKKCFGWFCLLTIYPDLGKIVQSCLLGYDFCRKTFHLAMYHISIRCRGEHVWQLLR